MSRPESYLWNNKREKEKEKKVLSKGIEPVLYLDKAERKIMMIHGSAAVRQRFREGKRPELLEGK